MLENWDEFEAEFEGRCHSEIKRSRADRSINNLTFLDFKNDSESDEEAFRMLIGELERSSCLVHDEDQSNHAICTALWSAVEEFPWSLDALAKPGIEFDYHIVVESLADSIKTVAFYITYSNNGTNPYGTSN